MPFVDAEQRAARNESVGQHLKAVREERGASQADLAKVCGVSRKVIADYESGKKGLAVARAVELGEVGIEAAMRYLVAESSVRAVEPGVDALDLLAKAGALAGAIMAKMAGESPGTLHELADQATVVAAQATRIAFGARAAATKLKPLAKSVRPASFGKLAV